MAEMIERVARMICLENGHKPETPMFVGAFSVGAKGHWIAGNAPALGLAATVREAVPAWMLYIGDARATIEAMREPTHAMVLVMEQSGVSFRTQQCAWPAAIDAALSEP